MKKLESNLLNMSLVLTIIALLAACALAQVYNITKEPIAASHREKQQNAIKDVLPEYDRLDDVLVVDGSAIFKAYKGDDFVGAAVESTSKKGFNGDVKVMIGFDVDGNIVNYNVLQQAETPGLGTKMVDWFKTEKNKQSILKKNPSVNKLTVSKDGGEVDAITASTISSRAFLDAVNIAYSAYKGQNDNYSGASPIAKEIAGKNSTVVETAPAAVVDTIVQ